MIGTIKAVSEKNKSVLIDTIWYSAQDKAKEYIKKELKGAEVELSITKGNNFNFLKIIKNCKQETTVNRIEKQCFMKIASTILTNTDVKDPISVVNYAKEIEEEFNRWCSE